MKRIGNLFLVPLIVAAMVAASTNASASNNCSVATLRGAYTLYYVGNITDPNTGIVTPFDVVGVNTFDGRGNASGTGTFSVNGLISTGPFGGTYTVNADCTGVFTGNVQLGTDNSNFVIVGGGTEVQGIDLTPGFTSVYTLKKQFATSSTGME